MKWIQPKTDWENSSKFNITDYNRIKGNLNYLHGKAEELYKNFDIIDMGEDKTYFEYPYAREINNFEKNLEIINQKIFTQDIGKTTTFCSNGVFIQAEELNRIESAMLLIYEMLDRQKAGLRRLSFRLGNMRGFRI